MSPYESIERQLRRRSAPTLFVVAAAFAVGVLITALVAPERSDVLATGSNGGFSAADDGGEFDDGSGLDDGAGLVDDGTSPDGGGGAAAGGATGASGAADSRTKRWRGDRRRHRALVAAAPVRAGGGASGGGGAGGAAGGATGPGVTADTITIGFGLPDLGAIGALGPGYDQGDPKSHVEGILAQLRADGRLPVHGRDIKPVFSSYNILSEVEQRATCEQFGNDTVVLAVVAIHDFGVGNECTAREFGLPTFTSDGNGDAVYARSAPNLFTMQMSAGRLLRNYSAWADRAGYLTGKRIGVYSPSDPEAAKTVTDNVINPIKAAGHNIVAEVQTGEPSTGGPTDSIAVQQFRTNRVDVAILIVSAVAKTNFFNQAGSQGYKPRYLENDSGFSTTDTATGTYPADHFDGTPAFTGMRFGENNSGMPEPAPAQWCRAAIKKQTGNDIPRKGRDAEYIASNQACDEIMTVMHGLEKAGPNLTRASFIAGVETIRNMPAGIHGDLSFSPGRHDGVSTWREIKWTAGCKCWKVVSGLEPLLVK